MDYRKYNEEIWDYKSQNNNIWSIAVSSEEIKRAKEGEWDIVLTPKKKVPHSWFLPEMKGKKVLCLASGGGQQGPIMAAIGANVTVFDNSKEQLKKDEMVAQRDGLTIETVQGDMKDLSVFSDASFDFIVHPWSNGYSDDVLPVWQEAARVLKSGGIMIAGFGNPIEYIFDLEEMEKGNLSVRHKIPYSDLEALTGEEIEKFCKNEGVLFGHTLEDQIGGQIEAGFAIIGFYEDIGGSELDKYIYSSIATKAIKL